MAIENLKFTIYDTCSNDSDIKLVYGGTLNYRYNFNALTYQQIKVDQDVNSDSKEIELSYNCPNNGGYYNGTIYAYYLNNSSNKSNTIQKSYTCPCVMTEYNGATNTNNTISVGNIGGTVTSQYYWSYTGPTSIPTNPMNSVPSCPASYYNITAKSDSNWLIPTISNDNNGYICTVTYTENTENFYKTGGVTIYGGKENTNLLGTITISQNSRCGTKNYYRSISNTSLNFTSSGGTKTITVYSYYYDACTTSRGDIKVTQPEGFGGSPFNITYTPSEKNPDGSYHYTVDVTAEKNISNSRYLIFSIITPDDTATTVFINQEAMIFNVTCGLNANVEQLNVNLGDNTYIFNRSNSTGILNAFYGTSVSYIANPASGYMIKGGNSYGPFTLTNSIKLAPEAVESTPTFELTIYCKISNTVSGIELYGGWRLISGIIDKPSIFGGSVDFEIFLLKSYGLEEISDHFQIILKIPSDNSMVYSESIVRSDLKYGDIINRPWKIDMIGFGFTDLKNIKAKIIGNYKNIIVDVNNSNFPTDYIGTVMSGY